MNATVKSNFRNKVCGTFLQRLGRPDVGFFFEIWQRFGVGMKIMYSMSGADLGALV